MIETSVEFTQSNAPGEVEEEEEEIQETNISVPPPALDFDKILGIGKRPTSKVSTAAFSDRPTEPKKQKPLISFRLLKSLSNKRLGLGHKKHESGS